MSAVTAEVQVLTAEVRVLMVGSRQVTLSVYRQLDEVSEERIEPFGRVRDTSTSGEVWVVGRDTSTGALVRAVRRRDETTDGLLKWFDVDAEFDALRWAIHDPAAVVAEGGLHRSEFGDALARATFDTLISAQTFREACTNAPPKVRAVIEQLALEDPGGGEEELRRSMQNLRTCRRRRARSWFAEWEALPLIVLAGLR